MMKIKLLKNGSFANCENCSWKKNSHTEDFFKIKVAAIKHSKKFKHLVKAEVVEVLEYNGRDDIDIIGECADIANFSMMIAEYYKKTILKRQKDQEPPDGMIGVPKLGKL